MAKISTYPILSTPTVNDLLIGTDVENLNETKNFSIGDIGTLIGQDYVPYVGATGNVNLGSFNITGGGFIVGGGTASQFLKADGSLDSTLYTPQTRTLTINGTTYNLSANRSWDLNTIDSLTTTGTSGAATYVGKVLNIPVYQAQGSYITQLSGEATGSGPGNATVTLDNTAVISKILTGLNVTGGTVVSTDTILQAFGKIQNQINGLAGGVEYQGVWNAATNTPTLQSSVGTQGHYYVVDVAGNTNLNGITDWQLGDWAIYNGSVWQKVDNTDAVVSVNGYVGAVVLTASDVGAVPTTRTLTINGVGYNLSADRAWTVGDVRTDGSYANPSWITSLGWSKITGTPTTLAGYGITDGALNTTTLTINGTTYDLTANRSWSVGTVTSVGTSGPLTGGTITGSGTIGITQSSSTTDGYLSSADWNAFNSKQGAISVNAPLTFVSGVIGITQSGASTDGYLSSTDWNTFNSKVSGSGTANTLPMWGSASSLINSPLSYAADVFNFQYNSSTGGTINFTNIGLTAYTYSIQMNNFGSPRSTIHSYTDGLIIQSIGGTQVSRMFANGNLILGTGTVDNGYKLEVTGNLYLNTIANAATDTDRFIVSDGGLIKYRTGAQVLSDIGAQGALTLTTTGSSGPATLIGDTLNIPNYSSSLTGYVPYTGATQNVNLGEYGLTTGFLGFDLTPTGTPTTVGTMYWDPAYRTASLITGTGATTIQVGQEEVVLVHNNTGSALTDGQVVYVTGSTGNLPSVSLADASLESTSAATLGVVTETIANGADGFVTLSGIVNGLNTLAYNEGDILWLSETAGQFTNIKPVSPAHLVLIGYVIKRAGGNGSIFVKIQNTQELAESSDVLISAPEVDGQGLFLQTVSGVQLWRNRSIADVLGYTPANAATTLTINGTTFDLSANRTWSVGTVTSVAALTLGTSGTDLSSTVSNGTTTPVITLNVPTASATNRGALSSSDWTTFNNKLDLTSLLTGYTVGPNTPIAATDSLLTAFGELQGQINARVSGTLATGQVAFGTAANTIGGDNGLFWDNTNKRLGIGTNSPAVRFVAETIGLGLGTVARFTRVNGVESYSFNFNIDPDNKVSEIRAAGSVNGSLSFATSNIERWRITSAGILQSNGAQTIQTSTGNLTLATAGGNGNIVLSPNGTGVVAIGTTSFQNIQSATLNVGSNRGAVTIGLSGIQDDGTFIDLSYQRPMTFSFGTMTSNSEAMRLTSANNLLVGTTSDNGAKLQVSGASTFTGIGTFNNGTNSTNGIKIISTLTSSLFTGGLEFIRTTVNGGSKIEPLRDAAIGGVGLSFQVTANNTAEVNATYTSALQILNTGAATFSSSVTADGVAFLGQVPTYGSNFAQFSNSSRAGANQYSFLSGNAGDTYVNSVNSQPIYFRHNNVDLAIITSSGNLLVGTTTDNGARLQVSGTAQISGTPPSTNGGLLNIRDSVTATNVISFAGVFFNSSPGNDYSIGKLTENGSGFLQIRNANSGAELLRINSTGAATFSGALNGTSASFSGTVTTPFIGVTGSTGQIGNINSTNANGGYITWQTSGTTIADLGSAQQIFGAGGSDTFGINARGARSLMLGTNDTTRLTISSSGAATFSSSVTATNHFSTGGSTFATSSGQVGIGTSSFAGDEVLMVSMNGTTNTQAINVKDRNAAASSSTYMVFRKSDDTFQGNIRRAGTDNALYVGGNEYISFGTGGNTERMRITSSGNVGIGTTSPSGLWSGDNRNLNILSPANNSSELVLSRTAGSVSAASVSNFLSGTTADFGIYTTAALNYVVYTNNTERMRISSTGNVGIGTASPNRLTEIVSSSGGVLGVSTSGSGSSILYGRIAMYSTAGSNTYIDYGGEIRSYSGAGIDYSDLRFYTAGGSTSTERMRITSGGNVLVGNTSAYTSRLTVQAAAGNRPAIKAGFGVVAGNGYWVLGDNYTLDESLTSYGIDYSSGDLVLGSIVAPSTTTSGAFISTQAQFGNLGSAIRAGNSGDIYFFRGTSTSVVSVGGAKSMTESMRLNSSGNLLIGTNSDNGARLQVNGHATFSSYILSSSFLGTTDRLYIPGNRPVSDWFSSSLTAGYSQANNYGWVNGAGNLVLGTDGAERMRITSSGNVGIGTTSPSSLFTVAGTSDLTFTNATTLLRINRSGSQARIQNYDGGSVASLALNWEGGNVLIGTTTDAGYTLNVAGNAQIVRSGTSTALVAGLSGVTGSIIRFSYNGGFVGSISTDGSNTAYNTSSDYRLKQDIKDFNGLDLLSRIKPYDFEWKADKTRSYGVLAHELQEVINYAVTGSKDAEEMQGVDYSKLVPILIKAIQELNEKIK